MIGIDRFNGEGFATGSAIAVMDVRDGALRRPTAFPRYAYSPDWSPKGDRIVFSVDTVRGAPAPPEGALDLYLIRPDGSGLRRLTRLLGDRVLFQPTFTRDGRTVLATLDEPGARRGVRVDARSGTVIPLQKGRGMTHMKGRP